MMKALLILVTMVVSMFGFAGGGGSDSSFDSSDFGGGSDYSFDYSSDYSGSGGSGELTWEGFFLMVFIFVFCFVLIIADEKLKKRRKGSDETRVLHKIIVQDQNNTEQEEWIRMEARQIFIQYQKDWSEYNLENIRKYTTDRYFQHASLMLEAIERMGRRNVVSDLTVEKAILSTPVNEETKLPVTAQLIFRFGGKDSLIDIQTESLIYADDAEGVTEYWDFVYDGETLKLDGITQSTESTPHLVESIAEFAKENNLFYSPDWGRLVLPTSGIIFDNDDILTRADVNNHVIGKWGDCLIQIYTYSAMPGSPDSYYIVGQISVPKSYEGIIIRAKKAKLKIAKPEDYEKFEMEWADFNERYEVYAASRDALPAFELLNPAFMERLYQRNLPYNLEVKGNIIYVFAKVGEARKEDYAELLNVLSESYKELKM